jgi:predicted CXXCH cytochrome family protein
MQTAATHEPLFPWGPDSSHAAYQDRCDDCHKVPATAPATGWVPSPSFKGYTCSGCHVLVRPGVYHDDVSAAGLPTLHTQVSGFGSTVASLGLDAACYKCHPQGIAVDHVVRFPLPHQNAAATIVATCSQCHVDPANRKVLGCAGCHPHDQAPTTAAHAKVPDFSPTDSALCARCHGDSTVPRVAQHAPFVVESGKHAGAAGGKCLACHPQNRAAPKAFAADWKATTCVGCHVQVGGTAWHDDNPPGLATLHAGVTDYATKVGSMGLSAACLSCHPDGAGGAPANHPQLFPVQAGTKHAGIGCSQCHLAGADKKNPANLLCEQCHRVTIGASLEYVAAHNVGGYGIAVTKANENAPAVPVPMTSPNCVKCHADSQVDRAASHPGGEDAFGTGEHRLAGCLTCHTQQRADKPYPATNWNAEGGCNKCH